MKGISHFIIGVAAASCIPGVVEAGSESHSLYFVLGGAFGILPDTIDFKFVRFLYKHDIEVMPDPNSRDPKLIADAVALAVNRAHSIQKPVTIKLNTIPLGPDSWQSYRVGFDIKNKQVCVSYGPIVNTGGQPIEELQTHPSQEACSRLTCELRLDYMAVTTVDIFDGPSFEMCPDKNNRVTPHFIPWHRSWSHSIVIAMLFAMIGVLIWNITAGIVIFTAYSAHIVVDQLGFMGSNMFFPFTKIRTEGMKIMHSGESFHNFFAVWTACIVIFWNLYCNLEWTMPGFNLIKLTFYGLLLPIITYKALKKLSQRT